MTPKLAFTKTNNFMKKYLELPLFDFASSRTRVVMKTFLKSLCGFILDKYYIKQFGTFHVKTSLVLQLRIFS